VTDQRTTEERSGDGREPARDWDASELAIVLSHYKLGVIERIDAIDRGVGGGSKFRVRSEAGDHVLKRRREGRDQMSRVAFSHCVQVDLNRAGFPAPKLMGTARTRSSHSTAAAV